MSSRRNEEDGQNRPVREALGQSEAFLTFQECLSRVAKVERPVLIIGERGTGKELAASRLHYLSQRWQESFIALNCAALPQSLIESELFGHEEGAFTGAAGRRAGRFEAAHEGSLFLDEIGNIPMVAQEKILRAVEYGAFERVGGSEAVHVDVRIIGATNADLPTMVNRGEFKRDLLDRLSFEVLFLPPLRARREDIMLLASHFAARMAFEVGWRGVPEFTDGAVDKLEDYRWPGNVRELKNVVERAVYRSDDAIITAEEIIFDPFDSPYGTCREEAEPAEPANIAEAESTPPAAQGNGGEQREALRPLQEAVAELETGLIRNALEQAQYNQRKAAELLDLTYHQFRGLYRKYREALSEES
jgi:psp operon transcriptional activator